MATTAPNAPVHKCRAGEAPSRQATATVTPRAR
jgi:hypothetical protein